VMLQCLYAEMSGNDCSSFHFSLRPILPCSYILVDIVLRDSGYSHEAREQSERLWIRFFYGSYGLRQGNKRNAREISRHSELYFHPRFYFYFHFHFFSQLSSISSLSSMPCFISLYVFDSIIPISYHDVVQALNRLPNCVTCHALC
jgi:hypothetical protein